MNDAAGRLNQSSLPNLIGWVVSNSDVVRDTYLTLHQDQLNKNKQKFDPVGVGGAAENAVSIYGTSFRNIARMQYVRGAERRSLEAELRSIRDLERTSPYAVANRKWKWSLATVLVSVMGLPFVVPFLSSEAVSIAAGVGAGLVGATGISLMYRYDLASRYWSYIVPDFSSKIEKIQKRISEKISEWQNAHEQIMKKRALHRKSLDAGKRLAFAFATPHRVEADATCLDKFGTEPGKDLLFTTRVLSSVLARAKRARSPSSFLPLKDGDLMEKDRIDGLIKDHKLVLPPAAKEGASLQAVAQAAKARQRVLHRATRLTLAVHSS